VSRTEAELVQTARLIEDAGGESAVVPADVTDAANMQDLTALVDRKFGGCDLLVNGAGRLAAIGPAWQADPEDWWRDVEVNVRGVWLACRSFLPGMIKRGRGRVVNMVGGGTAAPFPFVSAYATSKAAVMRLTENLALELDHQRAAPRVFALSPGFVRTAMTEQFADTEAGRRWMGFMVQRFETGEDVPPDLAAEVAVTIATGSLDALHGRYLRADGDVDSLEALAREAAESPDDGWRRMRLQP
jgi:NAD(P)-dependent dehydrogenase (short-subunit alcohol dehydrogenase family)